MPVHTGRSCAASDAPMYSRVMISARTNGSRSTDFPRAKAVQDCRGFALAVVVTTMYSTLGVWRWWTPSRVRVGLDYSMCSSRETARNPKPSAITIGFDDPAVLIALLERSAARCSARCRAVKAAETIGWRLAVPAAAGLGRGGRAGVATRGRRRSWRRAPRTDSHATSRRWERPTGRSTSSASNSCRRQKRMRCPRRNRPSRIRTIHRPRMVRREIEISAVSALLSATGGRHSSMTASATRALPTGMRRAQDPSGSRPAETSAARSLPLEHSAGRSC